MSQRLILIGASVRAAAFSARAGGYQPWCADLFADADLQRVAEVQRVTCYPHDLAKVLQTAPQAPWLYTGALENWPELIDELAVLRPIHGNRGSALHKSRNPVFWSRVLAEAGLPSPRVSLSACELAQDGSWLRKPLRSANGEQVAPWTSRLARESGRPSRGGDWYFQQRITGVPIAAIFVAAEGEASILGVTQQFVGGNWRAGLASVNSIDEAQTQPLLDTKDGTAHETSFRYAGSLGPFVLKDSVFRTLERIGDVLARSCGLVGLFGLDAILNSAGVWSIEINPRYTASIEVLERASAMRTRQRRRRELHCIELHEAACCLGELPSPLGQSGETVSAKLIYYAADDIIFSQAAARWAVERNLAQPRPAVADIPLAGSIIRRGQPVLTLLADGSTGPGACAELGRAANELEFRLQQSPRPL